MIIIIRIVIIIINVKIIVTLSQKNAARALYKTSKFAVNAVQQIDSGIMSGLQRMP